MSRDVPFDEDEFCDLCGTKGAFDFMGDYICAACIEKLEKAQQEVAEGKTVPFADIKGMPMKPELEDLRCDDCAFREGTKANLQQTTVMKAQLCAEIPEEFHCHRREGLCAGWAALANNLNREGYHAAQPDWQRKLKSELVEIINQGERGEIADVPDAIFDAMARLSGPTSDPERGEK